MEDDSVFDPPNEKNEQSFADFNLNEIIENNHYNNVDFGDFQELISLFEQKNVKIWIYQKQFVYLRHITIYK
jgi:hypothetical protein